MFTASAEDTARVAEKLDIARRQAADMDLQLATLQTGGLTTEQSAEMESDQGEPMLVRGVGSNPVGDLIIPKGIPPTYPLEWFRANNWAKPTITIPQPRDNTITRAYYAQIYDKLKKETINVGTVMVFIYKMLGSIQDQCRMDWISLGVLIGCKEQIVTPLDIVQIKFSQASCSVGEPNNQVSLEEMFDLCLLIFGGYRIFSATNATYIDRLQTALKTQLTTPFFKESVEVAVSNLAPAYVNPEFIKLLCIVDMFFAMFPRHPRAKLRFGTLVTSYKDCTGLGAITAGCDLMHHSTRVFSRWLMSSVLRADLNRMSIPGQEMIIPYSYSPHMSGFGIVDKSPYSAAINSGLQVFVHLIGCSIPLPRSVNAIAFQPVGFHTIIK